MKKPLSKLFRNTFYALLSVILLSYSYIVSADLVVTKSKPIIQQQLLTAGAIASPDKYGTEAAQRMLQKGGNAVDAAVATAFALAVTYPEAGNIGGGGFMTVFMDGKSYFIDYRETAPAKATANMYLDAKGKVIENMSLFTHLAAGTPGTVAGMWEIQKRFGKLSWEEVLAPAIEYARDGFMVKEHLIYRYNEIAVNAPENGNFVEYFGKMNADELFKQADLANTLERIAKKGASEFYQGETAQLIVEEMQRGKGIISADDLKNYKVKWRNPLISNWNGMQVITAPPPSSGGIGILQLLTMKHDLAADFKDVKAGSAQYIHLLAELKKRVFADRAEYMGDPDFVTVPVAQLLDVNYLAARAKEVNPKAISDTKSVKPGLPASTTVQVKEKLQTTHYSIVDKWGNAVANTYTINGWFGNAVVVKGAGIILNNEMDDFSSKPGVPNQYGVVGNDANAIGPLKRPLSSMSPTIITKDNQVVLVLGTPGGSRIFPSIFQVIVNVFDNNMSLKDAVSAPRYQHQLLPENTIFIERGREPTAEIRQTLEKMGYNFKLQEPNGDIQAIRVVNKTPEAMADPRGRGVISIVK